MKQFLPCALMFRRSAPLGIKDSSFLVGFDRAKLPNSSLAQWKGG